MLQIDLVTDILCPWCILGQHRLDKVLAERFPDLAVDIRHHPFLLMPDCPPEGYSIAQMLRERYGVTDPTQAWARPEAEARLSGLALDLSVQPNAYPSQAAHSLIRRAREHGTQHALAVAITNAYFLGARNIGDAEVLADLAEPYGFTRDKALAIARDPAEHRRTEAEAQQAVQAGIRGVPHFVFGGRVALNGGRAEDDLAAAIERALTLAA